MLVAGFAASVPRFIQPASKSLPELKSLCLLRNRQALIDARVKVFLLNDSNSKPEVWAAAILLGQYKMQDIIDGNTGPFFATVGKRCDSHIQRPRRPKGFEETVSTVQVAVDQPAVTSSEPPQTEEKIDLSRAKPGNLFPKPAL